MEEVQDVDEAATSLSSLAKATSRNRSNDAVTSRLVSHCCNERGLELDIEDD
jgi:hypothetical protein